MKPDFLRIAERATPFTAMGGRAFVSVPADNLGRRSLPLHSTAFRDWFYAHSYSEFDTVPSAHAFRRVCHHLHAQATVYPDRRDIRVAFRVDYRGAPSAPEKILLDLADREGRYVDISTQGWKVTSGQGAPFETSTATCPFPEPEPAPDPAPPLDLLRSTLRLHGANWLRALAWLLATLRPGGPYPILILRGPSGCGKSLAPRALRAMVDPSASPVTPLPASARELLALVRANWVLAFDHVTALTPAISDALCRLASGVGIAVREPGSPDSLQLLLKRPVILTAPDSWTPSPDLAARALIVTLPPLDAAGRRAESELSGVVEAAFPAILGALCTLISRILAAAPVRPSSGTRHTDLLGWTLAAAPALNIDPADLQSALEAPPPSDPFIDAVRVLLRPTGQWSGTATDLLFRIPLCPSARSLSALLHRNLLPLAAAGIRVEQTRNKHDRLLHFFASPTESGDGPPGLFQASASSPVVPSREAAANPQPLTPNPEPPPRSGACYPEISTCAGACQRSPCFTDLPAKRSGPCCQLSHQGPGEVAGSG